MALPTDTFRQRKGKGQRFPISKQEILPWRYLRLLGLVPKYSYLSSQCQNSEQDPFSYLSDVSGNQIFHRLSPVLICQNALKGRLGAHLPGKVIENSGIFKAFKTGTEIIQINTLLKIVKHSPPSQQNCCASPVIQWAWCNLWVTTVS